MEIVFEDRAMVVHFTEESILLLADLHLGFERELEERGVIVPSQHKSMLPRIKQLVDSHKTSTICIVGDIKHSIFPDINYNWEVIPEFMESLLEIAKVVIVPGNHDGDLQAFLPRSVVMSDSSGISVDRPDEKLGVFHGHAWAAPELLDADVMVTAHNHPVIRRMRNVSIESIGREGRMRYGRTIPVVVKSRLDRNCVRRELGMLEIPDEPPASLFTLPTFNEMFSGVAVNTPTSAFHGPFFENGCALLGASEVFSTTGVYLGEVSWLREQFNETIKSRPPGN